MTINDSAVIVVTDSNKDTLTLHEAEHWRCMTMEF